MQTDKLKTLGVTWKINL